MEKKNFEMENFHILPFYKRWWILFKQYWRNKKENFKFPWPIVISLAVIIILVVSIVIIISLGKVTYPEKTDYSKEGFVAYDDLTVSSYAKENENYKFEMDYETTQFILTDKRNGNIYTSSPEEDGSTDTLVVYYSATLGTPKEFGNYLYSIDYSGFHRYMIKELADGLEVLYILGGKVKVDYTDLPQLIEKERFENEILGKAKAYADELKTNGDSSYSTVSSQVNQLEKSYKLNSEHGYYALMNSQSISQRIINSLYDILYNGIGYTIDDLNYDNMQNGIAVVKNYPEFEVSLRYTLTEDGLNVRVINDSIKDTEEYPLVYIDVLPYFSCVSATEKGYALVPDGSGALIDFNNNREYASNYEQRIYGDDVAKNTIIGQSTKSRISLGMYGIVANDTKGFINIIDVGAEQCSIVAKINSKSTTYKYNQVFYRFYYRETDTYHFESLAGQNDIQTWTNDFSKTDLVIDINPLDTTYSYANMAITYRNYLVDKDLLVKNDKTTTPVLDLTMLGGYKDKVNVIGINFDKVDSLSTPNQIIDILESLKNKGITNINLYYDGFYNGGIKPTYSGDIKLNNNIASRKDLNTLSEYCSDNDIDFYPSFNVITLYNKKNVNNNDLVKDQYGQTVKIYSSNEASFLQDQDTTPMYYLEISNYEMVAKEISDVLDKINATCVNYSDLANIMYGSYKNKNTIFRSNTIQAILDLLDGNDYNTSFEDANVYAWKYAKNITSLPAAATDYAIFKCSVPFVQLVLSGYVDYSCTSINLNESNTFMYNKMKAIETLSNIAMTWTADSTTKLIDTEYNYLYSTYYQNTFDEACELIEELNNLGIYSSSITNHEILTDDVVKVTYENGIEIILNYSNSSYSYLTFTIDPMTYQVIKEAN